MAAFLSQVERGKANALIDSLRRIAEALEVSMLNFLKDVPTEDTSAARNNAKNRDAATKYNPFMRACPSPTMKRAARRAIAGAGRGGRYSGLDSDVTLMTSLR